MHHKTNKSENRVLKIAKNGHKNHHLFGGSILLQPIEHGGILPHPVTPYIGGDSTLPLLPTQIITLEIIHANNIPHTQLYSTYCFISIQGVTRLHSQQSRETMPIISLHQEDFLVLTKFVKESITFFKVPTFINKTFLYSTLSLTK